MDERCENCACIDCDLHYDCKECKACAKGEVDGFCTDGCANYTIRGEKVNSN